MFLCPTTCQLCISGSSSYKSMTTSANLLCAGLCSSSGGCVCWEPSSGLSSATMWINQLFVWTVLTSTAPSLNFNLSTAVYSSTQLLNLPDPPPGPPACWKYIHLKKLWMESWPQCVQLMSASNTSATTSSSDYRTSTPWPAGLLSSMLDITTDCKFDFMWCNHIMTLKSYMNVLSGDVLW